MKKSSIVLLGAIVGICFILTILILSVLIPCPTSSQYVIFRIILSIAIGAFASTIPGLLNIKYYEIVSATGALGVFVLVYLFDPAKLVVSNHECDPDLFLAGLVFINSKEIKNVDLRVATLKKSTVTDEFGSFKIEYPKKEHKNGYDFRVIYGRSLDTSFRLENKDWHDLRFNFSVDTSKIAVNPVSKPFDSAAIKVPVNIPKKEIQNFFTGVLPESSTISYGGDPYCNFSMKYTDVKIQIKLTSDRLNVQSAKVIFKAIERANTDCPFQTVPPNTHVYDLSSATINGNSLFISFTPDPSNNPLCNLTLDGVINQSKIIATLNSERINMPDTKLVFKIRMDVQLELTE